MKVYSGYLKDEKELLSTSSGGIATILSRIVIQSGGCVFGVRYAPDYLSAEYCCVDSEDGLEELKGSKYITSKKGRIYQTLAEKLEEGRMVLYIGLGCDIGAVKKYCQTNHIDTANLFTIDILCHGPAVDGVHESFIKELESEYASKLTYFTIRHKKDGWTPFYIRARFQNGKEYLAPFDTSDYGKAFRTIARPSCTKCPFKGDHHRGDLCIGDYWGIKKENPGWNKNGVSIMIVQTDKGNQLIDMLDGRFYVQEEKAELALAHNPMYYESRKQSDEYDNFVMNLNKEGLRYAVSKLPEVRVGAARRLARKIKRIFGF